MSRGFFIKIITLLFFANSFSQTESEVAPPFNIKTITFSQNNENVVPVFQLGTNFQIEFDDLFGNEANYYYTLTLCDYDWKPSELSKNEYLQGFDDQRIQDYTNSLNTLQLYSHYKLGFPNKLTRCKVSGNYILKILNEDKEVVFSRKFMLYENIVNIPTQVRRARKSLDLSSKHNLDFAIKSNTITFINPLKNIQVLIFQNGQLANAIKNIKPQYTIGNDLIYKYDSETQFWAGNEFHYFDTKDVRVPGNNISFVDSNSGVYQSHLYPNLARGNNPYTNYPDINGNFTIRNLYAENNSVEADYSWVYFTLSAPTFFEDSDIYINGMFNNYSFSPENKMDYNATKGIYEKAIMVKQGFTNYQYVLAKNGKIDNEKAIDGNFYQTENNYTILVYYREINQRYDRIIGKTVASSLDIIN